MAPSYLPPPPPSSSSTSSTVNPQTSTNGTTSTDPAPSLQSLLNQQLTITLLDRRTIIGYLICIDHDQNFILRDSEEYKPLYPKPIEQLSSEEIEKWDEVRQNRIDYWPRSDPEAIYATDTALGRGWGGRSVGLVCIKGKDIGTVEVDKGVWKGLGGSVKD
ncbi:hypothetical protein L486_02361 [Kwoniella mangroviensis CBS 10435]|uniref:Sm domain-containing protein n=1 Tax=Kwoniella mangroviensis CBS 10435 TaxID=1331196 RepID=A0A1B9IVX4_9TREE|nr:uncharacterized protein I203_04477 [Kwoniella mangroviensis CBS 8507]OCF59689.1 hypothetical protein L486_02361 [Kwoniella mangroviensis CBS 10435]OCF66151.1 hypothetical protein I203_04477 [Kwoniella mangroviensis CBS 8507]OCF71210.1 hypothetical protein I204_08163 [Kwoniella mangroviensis CBS 8886]